QWGRGWRSLVGEKWSAPGPCPIGRRSRWENAENPHCDPMVHLPQVGPANTLKSQEGSTPPLGTIDATLWFGLGLRFARGLRICSMRPPFITTTRSANVMAGL